MFGKDTYAPKPETLFEPRPGRTTSIAQVYFQTFTRELGTQEPDHETYSFLTHPENIITPEELPALYRQWEGEDIVYYEPEDATGQVLYVGYYRDRRRSSPDFEIPEVCGGTKR